MLDEGKSVGGVARDLDLTETALREWVKRAQVDRTKGRTELTSAEREELARLRRENRIVRGDEPLLDYGDVVSRRVGGSGQERQLFVAVRNRGYTRGGSRFAYIYQSRGATGLNLSKAWVVSSSASDHCRWSPASRCSSGSVSVSCEVRGTSRFQPVSGAGERLSLFTPLRAK